MQYQTKKIFFPGLRILILIICSACLLSFSGCKKGDNGIFLLKAKLTRKAWKMKSLVDYETNMEFPVSNSTYEFKKDGTYIITPAEHGEKTYSTWELTGNKKYLKIGNNLFKINYLSARLLGLRYGSFALYYVPAD